MSTSSVNIEKTFKLPPDDWAGWMRSEYQCKINLLPDLDCIVNFYPNGYPCTEKGSFVWWNGMQFIAI